MIHTTCIRTWQVCLALLLAGVGFVSAEESAEKTTLAPVVSRPYRDGPLTIDDFAATRPADARLSAWTEFDYAWKYASRHERRGNTFVAKLTEIDVWVVLRRDKSWNARPRDPLLMDHEQGHFDLAHIAALEAQLKLQGDLDGVNVLTARGTDVAEATKKLEARLASIVKPYVDAAKQANADYDTETSSGRNAQAQAVARKAHRERIQTLLADLEKLTRP